MVRGLTLTPGFGEGTEWTDGFSGAGMVDTVAGLTKAVQDKNDAAIAAYSVGLAFDVVGTALNPLGAVIGAGVGWLIDHIFFLREPLDLLMGDNIAIRQETEKINAEAKKYDEMATTHVEALKKLDGWIGETADQFRKVMLQVGKELQAIGEAMHASGKIMGTMGACVTATRSLVRDIIAMVIGNLIGGALVAAGLAPITFGASIVAFIGTAVATALQALSRILNHITKLKGFLTGAAKSTDELGTALAKMGDNAAGLGKGGSGSVPAPPPVKGPTGDAPTIKGGDGPSGSGAPPKTDGPTVSKPPETGGGSTSTAGVTPPPINTGPKPQDVPLPPSPTGPKPQDVPLPPSPGPGSRPPSPAPGGGGSTGTSGVTPPPINTGPKPQDVPLPPSPTGPKPQDIPLPPSPGPGSRPPSPAPSGGPKPPETPPAGPGSGAQKPPDPNAPGAGGTGGSSPWSKLSWNEVKNHMDDFSKYGKDHLDDVLKTKFGKTPEEAAGISQWIKNFEELAAPGGHFMIAGKAFATGTLLHYAHELWKELAPDTASQKEKAGYMGDLRDYNSQH